MSNQNLLSMVRLVIGVLMILVFAESAIAEGIVTSGTIESVRVDKGGKGIVVFTQDVGGTPPGCVDIQNPSNQFAKSLAFDTNASGGSAIYSTALTAQVTGKTITPRGTDNCGIYANTMEDWAWGKIEN